MDDDDDDDDDDDEGQKDDFSIGATLPSGLGFVSGNGLVICEILVEVNCEVEIEWLSSVTRLLLEVGLSVIIVDIFSSSSKLNSSNLHRL